MVLTVFSFLLTLIVLIVIHEYGHFVAARALGVKVLSFSFGFGPVFLSKRDKKGTEFRWSLFPIGGYVKLLDESDGVLAEEDRPHAFNRKSLIARMIIVAAGPFFNLLFAFFAFMLVFFMGVQSYAPYLVPLKTEAAEFENLQEIVSLNNHAVHDWSEFEFLILPLLGAKSAVKLGLKALNNERISHYYLSLKDWHFDGSENNIFASLDMKPYAPKFAMTVGQIIPNSPAELAGLKAGDKIIALDKTDMKDWLELVDYVRKRPMKKINFEIDRDGQLQTLVVQTEVKTRQGSAEGFIGALSEKIKFPPTWQRVKHETFFAAAQKSALQTLDLTRMTFALTFKLFLGNLPIKSISGPLGIAQEAGVSAHLGLNHYLCFLALMSISLAVLNLLPIPLLDGGQLFYLCFELISQRPLSHQLKSMGVSFGLGFLILLTGIALYNDLTRIVG